MRIILAAILAAVGLTACAPVGNTADPNLTPGPAGSAAAGAPKSDLHTVTYRIGGSAGSGDLTYSTASGMQQDNGIRLPWHTSFKVRQGDFTMLDVSVQNSGSGTVTCEIDVDGQKVKAARSSGQFAIASCDHSIGF